jgi:hypothetical protein
MMDAHAKACADYALAGIERGGSYVEGRWQYHVNRDGRRVFDSHDRREAAMFAEELYERIQAIRRTQPQTGEQK